MAYGTVKVNNITFTNGGIDQTVTVSGIVQSISGDITATGTIQGQTIIGTSTVSGATVTGDAGVFTTATAATGIFTSQISGATITGNVGSFTTITGGTVTLTSGVFASGTAAAPSVSIGTTDNGLYSPGTDQVAVATNGTGRLFVDAGGSISTSSTAWQGTAVFQLGGLQIGASTYAKALLQTGGTSRAEWFFDSADNYLLAKSGSFSIFNTTANPITFGTNGSERMRITSAGLVGIGTSTVDAKLQIVDTGTAQIRTGYDTASNFCKIGRNSSGEYEISLHEGGSIFRIQTSDSANTPVTALTIDRLQRVGIGSTTLVERLHVNGSVRTDVNDAGLFFNSSTTAITGNGTSSYIAFNTSNAEKARLDSSGRLLVGTSTSRTIGDLSSCLLQVEGTDGTSSAASLINNQNNTGRASIRFGKSRGTALNSNTAVAANDALGEIVWCGADGTDLNSIGGAITCEVDGTPGANDMPGRLVFSTTADGASSPTERMRITSAGDVGLSSGLTLGAISPSSAGFYSTSAILGTGAGTNAVKYNTTTGKFTYDTSSRLNKDQIEDCPYGIAEIKLLQPRRYYRIDDKRLEVGFVADEVVGVLPEFVPFGPKSAITGNENDTESIPLGVNYEKLTAVLTAALQEAIGEIESLKARLTAAGI